MFDVLSIFTDMLTEVQPMQWNCALSAAMKGETSQI